MIDRVVAEGYFLDHTAYGIVKDGELADKTVIADNQCINSILTGFQLNSILCRRVLDGRINAVGSGIKLAFLRIQRYCDVLAVIAGIVAGSSRGRTHAVQLGADLGVYDAV